MRAIRDGDPRGGTVWRNCLWVVTPAKAGVQEILKGLKSRSERDWIPAFAGMTGKWRKQIFQSLATA